MKPCPTPEKHTHPDAPTGYGEQMEWAHEMCRTHTVDKCPGCGLFLVWRLHAPGDPKLHYSGAVPSRGVLAGWAACCSGKKAEKIREAGLGTPYPEHVTCKLCKKIMEKAGIREVR